MYSEKDSLHYGNAQRFIKNSAWYHIYYLNRKFNNNGMSKVRPPSPTPKILSWNDLSPYEYASTLKKKKGKRIESAKTNKRVMLVGTCII